jgi:SAM-dependent methyltransferase
MRAEAYEIMARTEDEHWWFVGRRRILEAVIETLPLPENPRILEIGAGTGGNLALLGRFGTVRAVELDDDARRMAREKTGLPVQQGFLPDGLPFDEPEFDLVCLFDVLEHIERDEAALRTLRGLLRPGGRLLLTVPAHPWLWSRHDEKLHHVRRYRAGELARVCRKAGFRIDRLSYFNLLLFPVAVLVRLADRLRAEGNVAGEEPPPPLVNQALRAIFGSERLWLRRHDLPFGVSLLAVLAA